MDRLRILKQAPKEIKNEFPDYPELILRLLFHRNLTTKVAVDHFFYDTFENMHDPFLFSDMDKACKRLYKAITDKELIYLYGDYDADGIDGVVILEVALKAIGAKTKVYIPHREKEGYGLNKGAVDTIKKSNASIIITCDCGISNAEEVVYAQSIGIEVIVTDHHQMPEILPPAFGIIHPKRGEETYPDKNLAGGGVAYKLMQGILQYKDCPLEKEKVEGFQKWLLDLASISTVADMVPLIGENRVLTKYGILVLKKNKRLGLSALFSEAMIDPAKITAEVIAFQIAPRINAAGRIGHGIDAYKLLSADDKETASTLAKQINSQNKERQQKTDEMYRQALRMIDEEFLSVVLHDKSWVPGLTGLVAGKISKKYNVPTFIMTTIDDSIVGSGRSPDGINIMDALRHTKSDLDKFGGHTQACGFRFDKSNFSKVHAKLSKYFKDTLRPEDLLPTVEVDAEVSFKELDKKTIDLLESFKPFGQGNSEPMFYTKDVLVTSMRLVGAQAQHAKFSLKQDDIILPAIGFNKASHKVKEGDTIEIVYYSRINEWNGSSELQLVIDKLVIYE